MLSASNQLFVFFDIVIVNWNAGKQLHKCLKSIEVAHRDGFKLNRVVVVDNASTDDSADSLDDISLPLVVIMNAQNRGFAAACNQGAKESKADYLLFLNPDTRLFEDSLAKPLAFMELQDNQNIGIAGIQLVDDTGNVCRTCSRFPTPGRFFAQMLGLDRLFPHFFSSHFMTKWDHGESREVDQIMGAFFLIRRSIFDKLAGFDERFFVYFEEVDFSYRARQRGWQSFYLAAAQAYHKGGGTSVQVKAKRLFYSLKSRILFGFKHFSWWPATSLMLGTVILEPLSRTALGLSRRSAKEIRETVSAYFLLWRAMPAIFKTAFQKSGK